MTRTVTLGVVFTGCRLGSQVDLGPEQDPSGTAGAAGEAKPGTGPGGEGGQGGTQDDSGGTGGAAASAGESATGTAGGAGGAGESGGAGIGGNSGAANLGGSGGGSKECFQHTEDFFDPYDPERPGCACEETQPSICAQRGSLACVDGEWSFAPTDCVPPTRCDGELDFSDPEGKFRGCICDASVAHGQMCWKHMAVVCAPAGFWYAEESQVCAEANCYSPTQNTEWAGEDGAIGCACDPSMPEEVCEFSCSEGRWSLVVDGCGSGGSSFE